MQDHRQAGAASDLQLGDVEGGLPFARGRRGADRARRSSEMIQPDFAHRDQPRVVAMVLQCLRQPVQIGLFGAIDIQRVDAQGIRRIMRMGELANGTEVRRLHRGQHQAVHASGLRALDDIGAIGAELGSVEVAMRVDPHPPMMTEPRAGPAVAFAGCGASRNVIPWFHPEVAPMQKAPLYSRSPRRDAAKPALAAAAPAAAVAAKPRWRLPSASAPVWALAGALAAVALMLAITQLRPGPRAITQDDIDTAVRESLEKEPLPSAAAKAYEAILPSVVRVVGLLDENDKGEDKPEQRAMERSLGTGVVIIDNGTILTNLHVVAGARKIRVRFATGLESDAVMVGAQPENDLAVLKAMTLPDDLEAATMRSTSDLRPGDHVIAVGHPFGIGPSVSYGVVSGLKREFRSPEGSKTLSNLIQFDAAANPGNSGGPLVTMDGQVVGVVTAILNPSEQRTFIGIGFAVPIENAAAAAGMPPF